jgi:hypothetical protein
MIFKIFSPKKIEKKLAFLTQNKAKLFKFLIITLVFEKNAIFFAENWQKSQKFAIITSTPGHPARKALLPALKSENNQKGTNLLFGHLIFSVRIFFIQMYMHAYVCNDVPRSRYQFWVARF